MLNFFNNQCQSPPITDPLFGVCDEEDGSIAYISRNDQNKWIATIKNDSQIELIFTAIDKCVINDNEYEGRGRCDGMLTSPNLLYLIELKNKKSSWKTDAINQLESTIQFLQEAHGDILSKYKHKKAFACNKKARHFQEVDQELNLKFFRKYKFRIDVQATIVIVNH